MSKNHLMQTVGLALALATLAGCGNTALLGAAGLGTTDANAALQARGGKGGFAKGGPQGGGQLAQFATLGLSDEQKAQLQAIAEKYKPAAPAEGEARPEAPGAKIQAILTAETVDVDALKAALAEQPARPEKADNRTAVLVETRAVLTSEQIATLVAQLKAQPAQPSDRPSPPAGAQKPDAAARTAALATELALTAEQQAAFEAFVAKQEANRPAKDDAAHQARHEAQRAALITFWETGDTAALTVAEPAEIARPAFPVDELVALATSLSVEQRTQLFARGFGFGPGGKGGHGGPGGRDGGKHAGKGGHGGPGGHEGGPRGGQRPAPTESPEVAS